LDDGAHAAKGWHAPRAECCAPALTYTIAGWQIVSQTHMPLLTYARSEGPAGAQLIPGLAEAQPAVSPDGRTYTLRVRSGLRYSNGTAVRARDFEQAVKRVIALESCGASFYTSTISGAERYQACTNRRGRGDISGIRAHGRAITIRLTAPTASSPTSSRCRSRRSSPRRRRSG
jgi:peptide/nickel transport system substrate-binding protein